jgi:hypothetical protein
MVMMVMMMMMVMMIMMIVTFVKFLQCPCNILVTILQHTSKSFVPFA